MKQSLLAAFLICTALFGAAHSQTKENRGKNNPYSPSPNAGSKQDSQASLPSATKHVEALNIAANISKSASEQRPTVAQPTFKIAKIAEPQPNLPTETYKVGIGDVILVNIKNSAQAGGYFTVRSDGTIDFPLAGENVVVVDQTIGGIENILASGITLFPNPQIEVKVREYASHKITVTGMVDQPGEKSLQREAIPLFVIRAEAGVGSQATKVIVTRVQLSKVESYDLHDANTDNILIYPGNIVEFTSDNARSAGSNTGFYYIAGEVASAGQKQFTFSLTLYQAVIASGGTKGDPKKAVIRRKNEQGVFSIIEHDLRAIKKGREADPSLAPGDVIEIGN